MIDAFESSGTVITPSLINGQHVEVFEAEECDRCFRRTKVLNISANDPFEAVELCAACLRLLAEECESLREIVLNYPRST